VALVSANYLGSNPTNVVTTNTTANSNGVYGSLFTSNGAGGYQLMSRGTPGICCMASRMPRGISVFC